MTTPTNQPTIETNETDQPFNQPLIAELWHDYDVESPNEHDGLFRLVSFGRHHVDNADPETVLSCQFIGDITDPETGDVWENEGCDAGPHEAGDGGNEGMASHDYQPPEPIAAFLSYYEHGLGKWSRMGHGPADYGGFDTVSFAGVLILQNPYQPGDEFGPWWEDKTDEERAAAVDSFLDEYTAWGNGETYGYTILAQAGNCPTCKRPNEPELIDSCGGFIGTDYIAQQIRDAVAYHWGIWSDDVTAGRHFVLGDNPYGLDAGDILNYAEWADRADRERENA